MHSLYNSKNHGHQVLSPSSRCALNCQGLSIHLPPLGQGRDSVPDNDYISPPMSASWDRSKFDESSYHRSNGHRTYSVTPPSRPSTSSHPSVSGKLSPTTRTIHTNRLGKDVHGGLSTPNSTDRETSGTSLGMSSDGHARESNDEVSSNAHDSPEAQLISGPPGIARRAKAHVPSACVNCKKKHLACETKRPCSRCVQTGKESSCVDVQHKKRGRPRLREEDNIRERAFGSEYPHTELYSNPTTGVISDLQDGRRRSKTYRELRSQPEIPYVDQRPMTSDPVYSQHYLQGTANYAISPPSSNFLNDSIPTVLLTPDFVVAQHNRAFTEALLLSFTARAQTLLDLVVPAEREKIQRLQSMMRAELRDAAHSSHMRGGQSSRASMPAIEHLDIAHATAGFRTRSEYWTFRLPREQTRGFPISISLAKDGAHFIVLTLVQSTTSLQAIQSPPPLHQLGRSPPILQPSAGRSMQSPTQVLPQHSHRRIPSSDISLPYMLSSASPSYDEQMLQYQSSLGLAQYKQSTPPRHPPLPYSTTRTDSGSSGSSDIPRSSPGGHHQSLNRDNLRHLQLPPIRAAPTSDPSAAKEISRSRHQGETPSPSRSSPHSNNSIKRKKRRRVDIEGLLR